MSIRYALVYVQAASYTLRIAIDIRRLAAVKPNTSNIIQ